MDLMTAWVWYKLNADDDDDGGSVGQPYHDSDWKTERVLIGGTGIPVRWGQGHPFNAYCFDGKGRRALTGCVATAVAQAMAYYKFPESYDGYTFHWDEMLDVWSYSDPSDNEHSFFIDGTDQGIADVAYLMRSLGNAGNLNMNYGVKSSGTQCKYIHQTLHNFGFDWGGTEYKFNYALMMQELNADRPVIMRGCRKHSGNSGHAWVVDGYFNHFRIRTYKDGRQERVQKDEFVRCNWGWDGDKNGYAVANVFYPEDTFLDPDEWLTRANSETAYYRKTRMYVNIKLKDK